MTNTIMNDNKTRNMDKWETRVDNMNPNNNENQPTSLPSASSSTYADTKAATTWTSTVSSAVAASSSSFLNSSFPCRKQQQQQQHLFQKKSFLGCPSPLDEYYRNKNHTSAYLLFSMLNATIVLDDDDDKNKMQEELNDGHDDDDTSPDLNNITLSSSSLSAVDHNSSREFHQCLNLFDSFVSLGIRPDNTVLLQGLVCLAMVAQIESHTSSTTCSTTTVHSNNNISCRPHPDDNNNNCCRTCATTTTVISATNTTSSSKYPAIIPSADSSSFMQEMTALDVLPTRSSRVREMVARMESSSMHKHTTSKISLHDETSSSKCTLRRIPPPLPKQHISLQSPENSSPVPTCFVTAPSQNNKTLLQEQNHQHKSEAALKPQTAASSSSSSAAAAAHEAFFSAIDTVGEYLASSTVAIQHRKNVLGHLLRVGLLRSSSRSSSNIINNNCEERNLTDEEKSRLDQMENIFWSNDDLKDDNDIATMVGGNGSCMDCCWFWQLRAVTQHVIRQQQAKRLAIQNGSHQVATSIAEVACLLEETVLETTLHFCRGIDETGSWLIQQQNQQQQEQEPPQGQLEPKVQAQKASTTDEQTSNEEPSLSLRRCWSKQGNGNNEHCEGQQKENENVINLWPPPTIMRKDSTPFQSNSSSTSFALLEDRKNQIVYETYSDAALRATTTAHSTVSRALTVTKQVSRQGIAKAAQAFENQGLGEKLVFDEDHRTVLAAVADVGLASLGAVAVVGEACIESTSRVIKTTGAVTANIVEHKYGPSAGKVVRDGGEAVLNVWKTVALVKFVAPHVLTMILAKETGKQHLRKTQGKAEIGEPSSNDNHQPLPLPITVPVREDKEEAGVDWNHALLTNTTSPYGHFHAVGRHRPLVKDRSIAGKKEFADWISHGDCSCPSTLLEQHEPACSPKAM